MKKFSPTLISSPTCSLETQDFPKHCSKQWCHLHLCFTNGVRHPQGIPRGRKIPGNSSRCTNHKKNNLGCLICPARSWHHYIFAWSAITLSLTQGHAMSIRIQPFVHKRLSVKMVVLHISFYCSFSAMVKVRITSLHFQGHTSQGILTEF